MKKGKKIVVAAVVIGLAISYLVYAGVKDTMVYYLTIDEMYERVPDVYDSKIQVSGTVVAGTIKQQIDGSLEFTITSGEKNLDVKYKGIIPDVFRDDVEAIVQGMYTPDKVFQADKLLAKCPTKYESLDGIERADKPSGDYNNKGDKYDYGSTDKAGNI